MALNAYFGAGNVWLNEAPGDVIDKLEMANQLGLTAIRAGVRGRFVLPEPELQSVLDDAKALLQLCLDAPGGPFSVLFGLKADDPQSLQPETIRFVGERWGQWLADFYTGPDADPALAELVVGFSVQNEWCRFVREAGLAAYNAALDAGASEEESWAAGQAAAAAEADAQLAVINHFFLGLLDAYPPDSGPAPPQPYPTVWRVPGGLPSGYTGFLFDCVSALAALYAPIEGGAEPPLNAFGLHWYRNRTDFDIQASPLVVTPKDSFSARIDRLYGDSGVPAATPVFVQETNVHQFTFGWEPGDGVTEHFEAAAEALRVQLDAMFGDERVAYVGPFTPYRDEGDEPDVTKYTIQIEYVGLPGDWTLTPSGQTVEGYAPPPPPSS